MLRPHLDGCAILVVEDEPLIALDITVAFEGTGAQLTTTNTLKHATILVEHDGLCAAILDHALHDGDSGVLRARLRERDIPYITYSGFPPVEPIQKGAGHLNKPAATDQLLNAVEALIRDHRNSG